MRKRVVSLVIVLAMLAAVMILPAPMSMADAVEGGAVRTWGENGNGQLGDGTDTDRSVPVIVPDLTDITVVSGGDWHSLALKDDGTVLTWGTVPSAVSGLSNITDISAGEGFSLVLKDDGTGMAWGNNGEGQLGVGDTVKKSVPVAITDLSNATAISAGDDHSLALKDDGTVMAWGRNDFGQLGDGTNENSSVPVAVPGLSDVTAISAGSLHSLALKDDGTVVAWGYNNHGQLGDGSNSNSNVPIAVSGLSNVTAISAGSSHCLALKDDGTVMGWGRNSHGQLGNGSDTDSSVSIEVSSLSNVTAVSAGSLHSLALKDDGTVAAWGYNNYGQLGNGTNTDSNVPVVVPDYSNIRAIECGDNHSMAITSPDITSLYPEVIHAGGPDFTLTVNGAGFDSGSRVVFDGNQEATTYVSTTKLSAVIPATDITTDGTVIVFVSNTDSGISNTGPASFTILPSTAPWINSISPTTVAFGSELTINGSNFGLAQGESYVTFNSTNATSYSEWSDTQIKCTIPEVIGAVNVTVTVDGVASNNAPMTARYPVVSGYGLSMTNGFAFISFAVDLNNSPTGSLNAISFTSGGLFVLASDGSSTWSVHGSGNYARIHGYMNAFSYPWVMGPHSVTLEVQDLTVGNIFFNNADTFNITFRHEFPPMQYQSTGTLNTGDIAIIR